MYFTFRNASRDFTGDPVVKNLPAGVWDVGSVPGLERAHTPEQLSVCTTTAKACTP